MAQLHFPGTFSQQVNPDLRRYECVLCDRSAFDLVRSGTGRGEYPPCPVAVSGDHFLVTTVRGGGVH